MDFNDRIIKRTENKYVNNGVFYCKSPNKQTLIEDLFKFFSATLIE